MVTMMEQFTKPLGIASLLLVASIGFVLFLVIRNKWPGFLIMLMSIGTLFISHAMLGLVSLTAGTLLGASIFAFVFSVLGGSVTLFTIGLIGLGASLFLTSLYPVQAVLAISLAVVVAMIGVIVAVKVFGRSIEWLRKLVLTDATDTESGYVSNKSRTDLLQKEGLALTSLRPAGIAQIGEERLDVVSDGSYIEKGEHVRVVQVEGARIVVTKIEKE